MARALGTRSHSRLIHGEYVRLGMTRELKFFNALRDVFVGAKVEGESGYINLMRIKSRYYEMGVFPKLQQEVNEALIRFRLENNDGTRLRNVVFARPCLQKLADDSVRDIKIDYLRRDLERVSKKRDTYVYPHSLWAILDD